MVWDIYTTEQTYSTWPSISELYICLIIPFSHPCRPQPSSFLLYSISFSLSFMLPSFVPSLFFLSTCFLFSLLLLFLCPHTLFLGTFPFFSLPFLVLIPFHFAPFSRRFILPIPSVLLTFATPFFPVSRFSSY